MTPKRPLADRPTPRAARPSRSDRLSRSDLRSRAGRAALVWSLVYATGAALAALTGPAFGYALLAKETGAAAETAAAALYGAAAVLGYAMLRRPHAKRLSTAAWVVVALCLTSGFAALLSPSTCCSSCPATSRRSTGPHW